MKPKLHHPHIGKLFILRSTDTGNFCFVICNVREPGTPRGTEDGAGMLGIHSGLKAPPGILRVNDRAMFDFGT